MTTTTTAPAAARARVELIEGMSSVTHDGVVHALRATDIDTARTQALDVLRDLAASAGAPLSVTSVEPAGHYDFIINPDGTTQLPPQTPAAPPAPTTVAATTPPPSPAAPTTAAAAPRTNNRPNPATTTTADAEPVHQPTRRELQAQARARSLLEEARPDAPARAGARGVINSLGLGLALPPSARELAERADTVKASQHWDGPRTIAVVNGKGGSSKTTDTVLLAALFAKHGAGSIIAWDNNATRGTLGWRTEKGPHDATVADLLPAADRLLGPTARAGDLAAMTHHQTRQRFDVLRSNPEVLSTQQPVDEASFKAVHAILAKYYRLILIDSGNDESSPSWAAMIERADAIVVPMITRPEHAESARLLLAELARAGGRAERLADQATVIISQASKADPSPHHYVQTFTTMARAAVGIPSDPRMAASPLLLDALAPATRRAWLAAGAPGPAPLPPPPARP